MTELLYYRDPGLLQFRARIDSIENSGKKARIVLDKTAFYPEGGGQPSDRGSIDGLRVTDVRKSGGLVVHTAELDDGELLPEAGAEVDCIIDEVHRLDYQQQHSGQHIISAAMMSMFGAATVSVHQGEEYTTIEVSEDILDREQLLAVEDEANRFIRSGTEIRSVWTDSEGLKEFDLRRPSKHDQNIRIVEIPGIDCVACGGLHLESTAEIGLVKYSHQEKIRGNVRTFWKIGNRAYRDYEEKTLIINELREFYSARQFELLEKTRAAAETCNDLSFRREKIEQELALLSASMLIKEAGKGKSGSSLIINTFSDREKTFISSLMKSLGESDTGLLAFIFNRNSDLLTWAVACTDESLFDFADFRREMLPLVDGKGGGTGPVWQGVARKPERLGLLLEKLAEYRG